MNRIGVKFLNLNQLFISLIPLNDHTVLQKVYFLVKVIQFWNNPIVFSICLKQLSFLIKFWYLGIYLSILFILLTVKVLL